MKYVCEMCDKAGRNEGGETYEQFQTHMRSWHGVSIAVGDLIALETGRGLNHNSPEAHSRMSLAQQRRRARERAAAAAEAFKG